MLRSWCVYFVIFDCTKPVYLAVGAIYSCFYSQADTESYMLVVNPANGDKTYTVGDVFTARFNKNSSNQTLTITALKNCHIKGYVKAEATAVNVDTDLTANNSLTFVGNYSGAIGYFINELSLVAY